MEINSRFLKFQQMKFDLFKSQNAENGLFDVVFEVDGKLLYANKNMLDYASPTFASMLSDRWNSKKDEPIKIEACSCDNFYQFLTFLYKGECQLTDENIYSMVDIAEFYGVDLFKEYCDEYISAIVVTAENVFQMMELADKYLLIQLKSSTKNFIANNLTTIFVSDGFMEFNKSALQDFITAHKDKAKPEDLFQAVYKWCEKQAMHKETVDPNMNLNDTIKNEISDFLPHMSFEFMNVDFLLEFVVLRGFIFSSYKQVFCSGLYFFSSSSIFERIHLERNAKVFSRTK